MRIFLSILGVVLLLVIVRLSIFTVDASEYAYVTLLGRHVATLDGSDPDQAGIYFAWPWPIQSVQRLDRRLQHFDLPATELLTHDMEANTIDKTLTVEAFVCWKIADREAVDKFIGSMGTSKQARAILGQRINSRLGAAVGQMEMDELISTDPGRLPGQTKVDDTMNRIRAGLIAALQEDVRQQYGIEIVDIRLRRFSHPTQVQEAIFQRIRSERNKKVEQYRSEGKRKAKNKASEAEEKERTILAQARYLEQKLKGEADAEAARIRNQAQAIDPEFYAFLKKLDKLQNILGDNKTVLLLSSHRRLFDLLFDPPGEQTFRAASDDAMSNGRPVAVEGPQKKEKGS